MDLNDFSKKQGANCAIFSPACSFILFSSKTCPLSWRLFLLPKRSHSLFVMLDILIGVIGRIAGIDAVHHLHHVVRFSVQLIDCVGNG